MTSELVTTSPSGAIFRLGRGPDQWEWPPWAYARPDGTFGNRWDDPEGLYRVMYACSQRLGTFIETLARFRPDPTVVAGLAEIDDNAGAISRAIQPGELPRSWLTNRRVGEASVEGQFVSVSHSASLAWLREAMADRLVHYGIPDLDGSSIRLAAPRRFTQEISRAIFSMSIEGRRRFDGIAYLSRLGDDFLNWAIFEPARIEPKLSQNLSEGDEDLQAALTRLGLTLVDG
ncbi:MAG: RES domain-containing protein [Chloroflexota bacterium]|nr:RES domain-containing protein [Chloroflexota bacterium]